MVAQAFVSILVVVDAGRLGWRPLVGSASQLVSIFCDEAGYSFKPHHPTNLKFRVLTFLGHFNFMGK
jgi:hypothetical protein